MAGSAISTRGTRSPRSVLLTSRIADASGSNGFESDNDGSGTTATPTTRPIFSNVSIFGPLESASTSINSQFKRAAHLRRNTKTSTYNSVFAGYPTGLLLDLKQLILI